MWFSETMGGLWEGKGTVETLLITQPKKKLLQRHERSLGTKKSEALIHGRNSLIRERDSYGNDPFPPKG
jgi:hypothetical protein